MHAVPNGLPLGLTQKTMDVSATVWIRIRFTVPDFYTDIEPMNYKLNVCHLLTTLWYTD